MLRVFMLAACATVAMAEFIPLQEVCRSSHDETGLCLTSSHCCNAIGGRVVDEVFNHGVSRGAMPAGLARSIGDENGNKGCSYNGICCILPEVNDFDCEVCGLKGNGDISKIHHYGTTTERPTYTDKHTYPEEPEKIIIERIVNGQDADPNEYCWQVALMSDQGLFAGGALIARNWVVTAAHKVAGKLLNDFVVVLGEYDFDHEDSVPKHQLPGGNSNKVYYSTALNVFIHPDFNPSTFDANIALIRIPDAPCQEDSVCPVCLGENVEFPEFFTTTTTTTTEQGFTTTTTPATTTYGYGDESGTSASFDIKNSITVVNSKQRRRVRQPEGGPSIDLPNGPNPYDNMVCYMTGWGSTGRTQLAERLQEAKVKIIRNDDCIDAFIDIGVDDSYMPKCSFCAAEPTFTRGSCYGDGGGPLVCQNPRDHTWELWGVISLGTNMCMENGQSGPSIFTDVGEKKTWITDTIHASLPDPADPADAGKTYKVPECGSKVKEMYDGICPYRPPYEIFNRRSNVGAFNQTNE